MGSAFQGENTSKIEVAKTSLLALLDRLSPDDRYIVHTSRNSTNFLSFGLFSFETRPHMIQPLKKMKDIEMVGLKDNIMKLRATGGTEFDPGLFFVGIYSVLTEL